MEAVPRLPMISFQLKVSPEPTDFGPKLKQYIRDFYNEDPESYSNEIHQLENLRAMAVRPSIAVTGCSLLQKYYCQLHFLQSRFPMGADEAAAVTFTWNDVYGSVVCSSPNIHFEIISILYNIGAVHTQLGARTERTTAEGMKMACAHFQCAAWAFEHLHSWKVQRVSESIRNSLSLDLAPELMMFMHQLCLAQAQECILEKSMLDNRKPTIVAKVAKQIVDYYSQALETLEPNNSEDNPISDTVGSKIYKNWKRYVIFKRAYHLAVTQLYQGLAAEEQQKMGERVAFYNASLLALNYARSMYTSAKGTMGITGIAGQKEAIEEALTFTNDVIEGKRKAAKNENEFIYHEEVPEKDVLPTVNGASLVKGIPFSVNDPEVSGPDIFARLVPMKVHEASSLYSEEKAKILRSVGTKIEERNQQLDTYLASLKLQNLSLWDPDAPVAETDFLPLPDELSERCAALNARPNAIEDLVDIMAKLSDTYRDVEAMLKEIDTLLTEEEQREKRYQETMGKRPPTIVATDLTREAKKYEEAHAKASESNQALHRAMTLHVNNLQVLAQPLADLMAKIPSPNANPSGQKSDGDSDKVHARELKRILGKVDEMQRQRNELHAKLRDSIAQDDLTRLLVTATAESGSLETLFSEQISKHQALVSLIDQNLAAQDNILAALTDAYARTADTRKSVDEILKRRELTINSLITSYDAYEDLLAKSTKGLEFYRKLEVNVTKLLQRVKSTCRVQEEEREQIMARNEKSTYGTSTDVTNAAAASTSTERKAGSGMKLRDHLAARLKSNNPINYQQTQYGNEKQTIPVAPIQPNSHGMPKTYPIVPTSGAAVDGIPVHAVTPVAAELQPTSSNQQLYQQYYTNDYTNYYMAQQQSQYHSHQYQQYTDDASVTNGGGTQSFPRTGTTNTDSMYRQASRHSANGTEVSSNSTRYAGYNNERNDQVSASAIPMQQYPIAGQTSHDTVNPDYNNDYTQYATDYKMVQDNLGYQVQGGIPPVQSVTGPSNAYHNAPPGHQSPYNQAGQSSIPVHPAVASNQSPSHVPPIQQAAPPASAYRSDEIRQDTAQPQGQLQSYENVQTYNYQILPQQQMPQPSDSPAAHGYTTSVINGNQQNRQQFSSHVPPSNSPYTISEHYPIESQPNSGIPTSDNSSMYPSSASNALGQCAISSNMYYVNATQASNPPQRYTTDYASPTQNSYPETSISQGMHGSPIPSSQSVQNYPNAYGTYPSDSSVHQYPIASSLSSQIGSTASYSNGTEMIQSHTKSTGNQGYMQNYQYPLQSHDTGIMQYPNVPEVYGVGYVNASQTAPGVHGSLTNSYRGPSGWNYDPSTGAYSYSAGYQDSNNGTGNRTTTSDGTYATPEFVLRQSIDGAMGQQIYAQQDPTSRYTNANNGAATNLTSSSQYPNGSYQSPTVDHNYYTTPHGNQSQNQDTPTPSNNQATGNDQTCQQVTGSEVKSVRTVQPEVTVKPAEKTDTTKSNLDLLSELDITINHAPLVPEVHSIDKAHKDVTVPIVPVPEVKSVKRLDSLDNSQQYEDKHENLQIVWDTWYTDVQPKRDPLGDPVTLQKFVADIEKYEKFVDSLTVKTLSGSTNLDIKWSEINDVEEREMKRQTCYVAQAHSSANRMANLVPYDSTRVRLSATDLSSDYINASHVNDLTQWTPAAFIVAQSPKPESYEAFWTMIWEQGSEVIACLATDLQLNDEIYWPVSKENNLNIGRFTLSLNNSTNHTSYVQRVITIVNSQQRMERVVVHMQYLVWPSTGLPSSPGPLLTFATDILSEQALRHCSPKPIIVHCLHGGSLSGLFLLASAAVCHVRAGHGAVHVPLVFSTLVKYRRCMLSKEYLLFGYRMVLYHAQDTLMKRGILSSTRSTFECFESMKNNKGRAMKKPQHCHPSDDFLHNLGVGIQHGIARQQGEQSIGQTNSQTKIATVPQEKTDKVDPLSQLDPLWSIRR